MTLIGDTLDSVAEGFGQARNRAVSGKFLHANMGLYARSTFHMN